MATEREKALKALVAELPEALKGIVKERVTAALESPPDFTKPKEIVKMIAAHPALGNVWNNILNFYDCFSTSK